MVPLSAKTPWLNVAHNLKMGDTKPNKTCAVIQQGLTPKGVPPAPNQQIHFRRFVEGEGAFACVTHQPRPVKARYITRVVGDVRWEKFLRKVGKEQTRFATGFVAPSTTPRSGVCPPVYRMGPDSSKADTSSQGVSEQSMPPKEELIAYKKRVRHFSH